MTFTQRSSLLLTVFSTVLTVLYPLETGLNVRKRRFGTSGLLKGGDSFGRSVLSYFTTFEQNGRNPP